MWRTESVALIFAARVSKVIKKVFTFSFSEALSLSVEWKEMEGSITIKNATFENVWASIYKLRLKISFVTFFWEGFSLILLIKVKISLKSPRDRILFILKFVI